MVFSFHDGQVQSRSQSIRLRIWAIPSSHRNFCSTFTLWPWLRVFSHRWIVL